MKRTHKFKELGDIQAVVAKASSLSAAAKALGVDRSTLHRWMEDGKVKRPRSMPPLARTDAAPLPSEEPKAWADHVRADYVLSATDLELVTLAADALLMAKTEKHARDKLAAAARFAALVRQLNLDTQARTEQVGSPKPVAVAARRRSIGGGDPRAILTAVK